MNFNFFEKKLQGEPKFRLKQMKKAIFVDLIEDWSDNTTLPKELKKQLLSEVPLVIDGKIMSSAASDSKKALITFIDGRCAETVLLQHEDGRRTVCVSSQMGCPLGCLFCATGKEGFIRNLEAFEIVQQVLFFARLLKKTAGHKRITNVVFMGMGEPFLNYENVISAVKILNDKECFDIGARHISVSTCGIIGGIKKLVKENLQINLAISLHAPNDELRSKLMPINKKYPLDALMQEVQQYVQNKDRRVMFEYVLIDGVNDLPKHATELASLVRHKLFMVNLIRYNPTGNFRPSKSETIRKFKNILLNKGIHVTQRHSFGQDIGAACGQLAGKAR